MLCSEVYVTWHTESQRTQQTAVNTNWYFAKNTPSK